MVEGEHKIVVWELSLSNDQLANAKVRADAMEASLADKSTCLDKSIAECMELCHLLAKT